MNQLSNGLRGGADIGYPYEIHCSNGTAEAGSKKRRRGRVGTPINLKHI